MLFRSGSPSSERISDSQGVRRIQDEIDRSNIAPYEEVDDDDVALCREILKSTPCVQVFLHEDCELSEISLPFTERDNDGRETMDQDVSRTCCLSFQYVLGAGGFGVVFAVRDAGSGTTYAMKILRPSLSSCRQDRVRFIREAELTAEFRHRGIVRILGRGMLARYPFILMELVSGGSLSRQLQDRGAFHDLPSAVRIMICVCDAIRYVNEKGLLHRDLKPENILLRSCSPGESAEVVVTDFGLARLLNRQSHDDISSVSEDLLVGSIRYMAPEVVKGQRDTIGVTADVFSLAAILYQMVTGHVPFDGRTYFEIISRMISAPVNPARQYHPKLAGDLELVLEKGLQRKVRDRYQSVAEFSEDLQRFLDGKPVLARQNRLVRICKGLLNDDPRLARAILVVVVVLPLALVIITSLYLSERDARVQNRELLQASVRNYTSIAEGILVNVPASAQSRYDFHLAALRAQELTVEALGYDAVSRYRLSIQYSYLAAAAGQIDRADLACEYRTACLGILNKLLEEDPNNFEYQYDWFFNRRLLAEEGWLMSDSERSRLKEDILRDILRLRELAPDDLYVADAEAASWYSVAQERLLQKSTDCDGAFRAAIRISEDLIRQCPQKLLFWKYTLLGRVGLASFFRGRNELIEAERIDREALQILVGIQHPEKEEVWFAAIAKDVLRSLASTLMRQENWSEAMGVWKECLSLSDRLYRHNPTSLGHCLDGAVSFAEYSRACRRMGITEVEATQMREEALARLEAIRGIDKYAVLVSRIEMVIRDANAPVIDAGY